MKKKVFNKKTLPTRGGAQKGCWISVKSSGNISFSRDLVEALKLEHASVEFIQDEERPKDWYIEISKNEDAIKLRMDKTTTWKIQSAYLCKLIIESLGLKEETNYQFTVATEPMEPNLYAILAKSAKVTGFKKSKLKEAA